MKAQQIVTSIVMVAIAGLCLVGKVSAAVILANTITVGSSDLLAGQSDAVSGNSGYNFRYSYGTTSNAVNNIENAYYQNGNFLVADQTGYATALKGGYQTAYFDGGTGTKNLGRDGAGFLGTQGAVPAVFVWNFDFANTGLIITNLSVRADTWWQVAGAQRILEVSTDGVNYTQYSNVVSPSFQTDESYFNLTPYVQGAQAYFIRATLYPNWYTNVRLFTAATGFGNNREVAGFDNQVWLAPTPEPTTIVLLGVGGLMIFSHRRRWSK